MITKCWYWLRKTVASALLAFACLTFGVAAPCAAPLARTQAPGYYRIMLGTFEITALNDGVVPMPVIFPSITPEEIHTRLSEMYLTDPIEMSFNAYLINTGSKLVLIDVGTGEFADAIGWNGAGHLIANLRAAGYQPEQVDEIYITHAHPDHVGGLMLGQRRAFSNATVHMAKSELDYYFDPEKSAAAIARAPDSAKASARFQRIRGLFEPYMKAGKLSTFGEDVTLVPGIRAMATHGHTPGHTSYIVESNGQTLIVLGDLVHVAALQFPNPWVPAASDFDPTAATSERLRVFQLAVNQKYWVAGAHLIFPGLGHIRNDRGAYLWIPANYEISK